MSPLYEFSCKRHGVFDSYRSIDNCSYPEPCPICDLPANRIISCHSIKIVQGSKSLPLGSGSPGRVITGQETGGMGVYIPSFGAMEQAEVDYIAEGAIEKEKDRVRKKKKTQLRKNQVLIQSYLNLANSKPRGQKAKAIRDNIRIAKEN